MRLNRKRKAQIAFGRKELRNLFYMASLSAVRFNPKMKVFYERLISEGKCPKVALTAVMRKMVVTLNAMMTKGQKWAIS